MNKYFQGALIVIATSMAPVFIDAKHFVADFPNSLYTSLVTGFGGILLWLSKNPFKEE